MPNRPPRLLITGASGLLGGCLYRQAPSGPWQVEGTAHTRSSRALIPLDLTQHDAVSALVRKGRYDRILHSAALRSPDYCLAHSDEAWAVNSEATAHLARAAAAAGVPLTYISTDYVFPGDKPPYTEVAPPRPINRYGETKLAGEQAVLDHDSNLAVRIPALYRIDLEDEGSFVTQIHRQLKAGETLTHDAETVRYYTCADDVAAAILFLCAREETGIIHLSAGERSTKAGFARAVATRLGIPSGRVQNGPPPTTGDRRPHDSHLAMTRYPGMGGPPLRGLSEVLADLHPPTQD